MTTQQMFLELSRRWSVLWQIERDKVMLPIWTSSMPIFPHTSQRNESHFLARDNGANAKRPLLVFERSAASLGNPEMGISGEKISYALIVRVGGLSLDGSLVPWWNLEDELDMARELLCDYFARTKVQYYDWSTYDYTKATIGESVTVREPQLDFWLRYVGEQRASESSERTQNKLIINFALEEQK